MVFLLAAASKRCSGKTVRASLITMALVAYSGQPLADPMISPYQSDDAGSAVEELSAATVAEPQLAAARDPLDTLMQSIVAIDTVVSDNAKTALSFGTRRQGSGVVLDTNGLIVTTGYTIAEASSVNVTFSDGSSHTAEVIAYDESTGLGLVQTPATVTTTPIKIGESGALRPDQLVMIIPAGGEEDAKGAKIGKISRFVGGWEYVVDDAIYTYPPSTDFSGAALVSEQAELLGIGALVTIDIDIDPKVRVPGNVFVPIDSLTAVLGELITKGRSNASLRPWLGLDTKQTKTGIVVSSVVDGGPAQKSGVQVGDVIVAVDQSKVGGQAEMYDKIWSQRSPGDEVQLLVVRKNQYANLSVTSMDRHDWLKLAPELDTVITEMTE